MYTKKKEAIILDDLISIHISNLYEAFNLQNIGQRRKEVTLFSNYQHIWGKLPTASIIATLNIDVGYDNDFVDIEFIHDNRLYKQRINLIAKNSSIKKGNVFYMLCPITGKSKRKLFLHQGKFISRQGIGKAYYISELKSQKERKESKFVINLSKHQVTLKAANKPYFKKYYKGFPTKRYLKLLEAFHSIQSSW